MATKMHITTLYTYSHLVANFKIYIYFMCINVLSVHMYVPHVQCWQKPQEGMRSPRAGVRKSCSCSVGTEPESSAAAARPLNH